MKRPPDEVIGPTDNPYIRRWWLFKPRGWLKRYLPVIYLHNIRRSDNARALHDHVSWNISILLKGFYWELMPGAPNRPEFAYRSVFRHKRSIVFRRARGLHSLQLMPWARTEDPDAVEKFQPGGVWSIWIRGPWQRDWGFQTNEGWKPWREYGEEA